MLNNLRELQTRIHKLNHRWWHDEQGNRLERNKGELLCLVHSEISEASEGAVRNLMDDHLPHRKMQEVEMADAAIRICDFSGAYGYDLQGAVIDVQNSVVIQRSFKVHHYYRPLQCHAEMHMYVSCAMEGERKGICHNVLTFRPASEVNLAIALILIDRFCSNCGYDLMGAIEEKLAYNQQRADHSYAARAAVGGKKW